MLRVVDWVSSICARVGDAMLVTITGLLAYEVVARYVLLSPTRWTQDVSTTMMIWFTYLGMAMVLRDRQMIRITALVGLAGPVIRRIAEGLSLIVISAFSILALVYAIDLMLQSIALGRRMPTMLQLPNWVIEIAVIIGFSLLLIQAIADLIRLPFRPAPTFSPMGEHSEGDDETRDQNRES